MKSRLLLALAASSALAACSSVMPHYHYDEHPATLKLTLLPHSAFTAGKPVDLDVKLTSIDTLGLITDERLKTVNGKTLRLYALDSTYTDFHAIVPAPTQTQGISQFTFTPKMQGKYRFFAEVTPTNSKFEEFPNADLGVHTPNQINRTESLEANHVKITFDKKPAIGVDSVGTVHTDKKLQPINDGGLGEIVGFYDDFHTVTRMPIAADGTFHILPVKASFIKLFAHVNTGGSDTVAPLGINVPADK